MGHHNLRFDGDPHSLSGAWSPPTSRANFCEEDYALTFYLAEFINSMTNLAYVYYALRSMYGPGSRGIFAPKLDFMNTSLLFLGFASFLFHASMRSTLEFADELSMMGLLWSMLQATCTIRQSPLKSRLISVCLAIAFIAFSVFYVKTAKIIYQVIAFITGVICLGLRTMYLLHFAQPTISRAKGSRWTRRTLKAGFLSVFGYVIWNIDLEFCSQIREIRQQIGLPWAWLLELHGWWHILTAIGASQFMDVAREIQEEVKKEKKKE